jgi:dolichol-phosphate mannosyltransferase
MIDNPEPAAIPQVAAILPCYKSRDQVLGVIDRIPDVVSMIICVDDACPELTGQHIAANVVDSRVTVIFHQENAGIGGAVCTGYLAALEQGAEICVKLDSDGQMDPALIPWLMSPIVRQLADYTKGNRFTNVDDVKGMPLIRIFGNVLLSFLTKLSTGYWNIFDPTNGFTAIHARVLERLPLHKISRRYFFESDMLFRLGTFKACVWDVPMSASYGSETSNLKISKIFLPFLLNNLRNLMKRIFYNYFLRDFSVASLFLLLSIVLFALGFGIGAHYWIGSILSGKAATAGQVMMSALPLIVGLQLFLTFVNYDVERTPAIPQHPLLPPARAAPATPGTSPL